MERYSFLLDAPFKISHRCCDVSKKNPAKAYEKQTGRKTIVATMASESRLRQTRWMRFGCNAFDQSRPVSSPLSFWTENDILRYIVKNDIQIADIYGDVVAESDGFQYFTFGDDDNLTTTGAKRTGCIWCLFGITQDPERLVRLRKNEPRRYEYVMNGGEFVDGMWTPNKDGLGYRFVVDWLNEHRDRKIRY
jgi:3'-phosphoadenosine 5'-phosphosulfate sulfotransferase (PAPS reductase)/FAD synthetase